MLKKKKPRIRDTVSSRRITPSSLRHSPGFQQLQAFSKDSTAQHSEDRAALL